MQHIYTPNAHRYKSQACFESQHRELRTKQLEFCFAFFCPVYCTGRRALVCISVNDELGNGVLSQNGWMNRPLVPVQHLSSLCRPRWRLVIGSTTGPSRTVTPYDETSYCDPIEALLPRIWSLVRSGWQRGRGYHAPSRWQTWTRLL